MTKYVTNAYEDEIESNYISSNAGLLVNGYLNKISYDLHPESVSYNIKKDVLSTT